MAGLRFLLIGGPAAATWLIAANFGLFNDQKKQKLTLISGVIALLALMGIGFVLPKNSSGGVFAAVVAAAARGITKQLQGSQIEGFRTGGGRIASWWSAAGIGLLCLVATLLLIYLIAAIIVMRRS